jgi:UPF0176 protein
MTPETTARDALFHIAFYRFVALGDPEAVCMVLRELTAGLTGSVLVAEEGINGVLAAPAGALDRFETALQQDGRLAGLFAGIRFRRSACKTPPFARMKVHRKSEIVSIGVDHVDPVGKHGGMLTPAEWRQMLRSDDVVVIDNRNSFEYRLGHFKSAVDPQVARFSDFPRFIEQQAPRWKAEGKRVAMYCTGGIRCEKTGAWMQELGIEVYQLEGGILNYFQSMPDADRDWEGECFVFDNRVALDTALQETGTTAEDVYRDEPDGEWRLQRARRLDEAV